MGSVPPASLCLMKPSFAALQAVRHDGPQYFRWIILSGVFCSAPPTCKKKTEGTLFSHGQLPEASSSRHRIAVPHLMVGFLWVTCMTTFMQRSLDAKSLEVIHAWDTHTRLRCSAERKGAQCRRVALEARDALC